MNLLDTVISMSTRLTNLQSLLLLFYYVILWVWCSLVSVFFFFVLVFTTWFLEFPNLYSHFTECLPSKKHEFHLEGYVVIGGFLHSYFAHSQQNYFCKSVKQTDAQQQECFSNSFSTVAGSLCLSQCIDSNINNPLLPIIYSISSKSQISSLI